jgi:hypothetical protein
MQEHNKSSTPRPKPRDGTQQEVKTKGDANWFGASQEPQEEFLESTEATFEHTGSEAAQSEGEPTFQGDDDHRKK